MVIILIIIGVLLAIASSVIKANNKDYSNRKVQFTLLIASVLCNTASVYIFIKAYVL